MAYLKILILCSLLLSGICRSEDKSFSEVLLAPYIEILDTAWSNKRIEDIVNAQAWSVACSESGKHNMVFGGNWYRLKIGNWLLSGDWVLLHPMASEFTLYRKKKRPFYTHGTWL